MRFKKFLLEVHSSRNKTAIIKSSSRKSMNISKTRCSYLPGEKEKLVAVRDWCEEREERGDTFSSNE